MTLGTTPRNVQHRSRTRPGRKRKQRPVSATSRWTIRYALVALVLVFMVGAVEAVVVNLLIGPGAARMGIAGILLDVTMLATFVPLYRRQRFRAYELGLRRAPAGASVGWVLLALIAVAITNVVWLQGVLGLKTPQSLGVTLHGSTTGLVLAGIFIAALAPVTEEIFFRGLLYRALRNRFSIPVAAFAGGFVFALVHGLSYPLDTLPPRLIFGIIACLLYERTGSLLPGMALHCFIDAGGYEQAISGHGTIVNLTFVAVGLVLLAYAAVRSSNPPQPPAPTQINHASLDGTQRRASP